MIISNYALFFCLSHSHDEERNKAYNYLRILNDFKSFRAGRYSGFLIKNIWSHTKFIPNETFLKKKNTVHLIFKILKNWTFQFINLTMNDSVNVHKAYIRSENPINPSNNPCLAIDMIYPWTLEIIKNFQLHTYLLDIRMA